MTPHTHVPCFRPRLPPPPFASVDKPSSVSSFYSVGDSRIEPGPTLGVVVMAWLFGLAGTIAILAVRSRATSDH